MCYDQILVVSVVTHVIFVKNDPKPEYYGGDDERPRLSRNFTQFAFDSKSGEEYLYLFVDNEWNGFSIDHKYYDNYEIADTSINPVEIPDDDEVAVA